MHRFMAGLSSDTKTRRNTRVTSCKCPKTCSQLVDPINYPRQLPCCRNIKRAVACYSCAIRTCTSAAACTVSAWEDQLLHWTMTYEHPKRPLGSPCLVSSIDSTHFHPPSKLGLQNLLWVLGTSILGNQPSFRNLGIYLKMEIYSASLLARPSRRIGAFCPVRKPENFAQCRAFPIMSFNRIYTTWNMHVSSRFRYKLPSREVQQPAPNG